ncbi:YfgM family protein [Luteimonas sp. SDU82]|uniref:YfgM family protein n=1 Tax=Luteimonas sp. SDU82 TaxID=3422592 RepID=UPI003EB69F39
MALDELLDEHEQGERVRNWLKQNSFGLIGGLALGLALIWGGRWWLQEAHDKRVALGESYSAFSASLEAGDREKAGEQTASLAGTAYAPLAALDLAKAQLEAGQRDEAIATLRGATSEEPALTAVIQHRLARLLIDAGKGDEALALLADAQDPAALETRGDARHAKGEVDQARQDYEQALRKLDPAAPQRRLLELKLTQAGGSPETTGTES